MYDYINIQTTEIYSNVTCRDRGEGRGYINMNIITYSVIFGGLRKLSVSPL